MCSPVSSEHPALPSRTSRGRAKPTFLRWWGACAFRDRRGRRLPWGRRSFSSGRSGRRHGGFGTAWPSFLQEEDAPRSLSEVMPVSPHAKPASHRGVCGPGRVGFPVQEGGDWCAGGPASTVVLTCWEGVRVRVHRGHGGVRAPHSHCLGPPFPVWSEVFTPQVTGGDSGVT